MAGERRFKMKCTTEGKIVYTAWESWDAPTPTTCPNDANHTIVAASVSGAGKRQEYEAQILTHDDGTLVTLDDGEYLVAWEED